MQIKFRKTHPDAIEPAYSTQLAAGLDLHARIPHEIDLHARIPHEIYLQPGVRFTCPTGIAIELPEGFEAQVRPRSGLAIKQGLGVINAPGTIDPDYRGEICALLINHGDQAIKIEPGMRIAQMVIAPDAPRRIERHRARRRRLWQYRIVKTFGLEEAAAFLRVSKDSMRDMADAGKVPAAKIGPTKGYRWVFTDEALEEYLRDEIERQTRDRRRTERRRVMHKAHETIWLQVDPDGESCDPEQWGLEDDATWCKDQINANDVEYVRADIAEAELEAARAEIERLNEQYVLAVDIANTSIARSLECADQLIEKVAESNRRLDLMNTLDAELEAYRSREAAAQAENVELREAALNVVLANNFTEARQAILILNTHLQKLPFDTSALEAMIAKAGEVMRELILAEIDPKYYTNDMLKCAVEDCCNEIRTLTTITLDDLKGGA